MVLRLPGAEPSASAATRMIMCRVMKPEPEHRRQPQIALAAAGPGDGQDSVTMTRRRIQCLYLERGRELEP